MSENRNRELISGILALMISAIFFACCLTVPALKTAISNYGNINILVYGMSLVLFCVLFLGLMIISAKWKKCAILDSQVCKKITFGVLLLSMIGFMVCVMALEENQVAGVTYKYGWHTQPMYLMLVIFAFEVLAIACIYRKTDISGKELDWMVWGVYIFLTILVWYNMYTPNIFGRSEYTDWYHVHAYYNSIYNVYWGVPYTSEITSIYGHYALLWKLPMELVGASFQGFVFLMAVVSAVTALGAFLVIHQFVESRLLRIVGAIAVVCPILGMRGGLYWQLWPHRLVFPMILLLYTVYIVKNQKQGWMTDGIAYILCMIAVIWNTETGIILAVSYAGMRISMILSQKVMKWKKFVGVGLFQVVGIIFSFAGAYGIINIYNVMKGSSINSVKEFLIPLLSDSYMTDILHLDLPLFPCGYMVYIAIFLMGVAMAIRGWKWFQQKDAKISWKMHAILFLCISGLGRLVYYMNRPAYHNLDCSVMSVIIMMLVIGEAALGFVKEQGWEKLEQFSIQQIARYAVGIFCVIYVLAMANGTVLLFSQNSSYKETFHNDEEVEQFAAAFSAYVPENTFGFGIGVPELYSWLGWNTQFYSIDFSDLLVVPETTDRLVQTLQEKDVKQVVTSMHTLTGFEKVNAEAYQWFMDTYALDQSFDIRGESYQFYVRKDVISE